MRKKFLQNKLQKLQNNQNDLTSRAAASSDAAELRSIYAQIESNKEEIESIKEELAAIEADERAAEMEAEKRSLPPADAVKVNGTVVGSFTESQKRDNEDPYGTVEYRKAFMEHVQTGAAIPAELVQRDGSPANTNTLGAIIPTTLLNEFINEVRVRYGNLYRKVRHLTIPGKVRIAVGRTEAEARWVTESTVSPKQNGGEIDEYIEFSANMLELRISQTLLSSIMALDLFEREVVRTMTRAFLKAMDMGIVRGTGNGQMLGILNDPRVLETGNVVQMSASDINDWTKWRKNFFAKIPLGYGEGEFIFPMSTVDAYLETMADNNNNPIFRQATGLEVSSRDDINPNGRFFGHDIAVVEPTILPDFDTAEAGDVVGIFWNPFESYAINTNMEFGMRRYFDENTNEWVNKMLAVVDGKVLDPKTIYLIKKKAN